MENHGINMKGKYYLQSVDTSVVVSEERQLVYDPNEKAVYFGDDTDWVKLLETGDAIPSGTKMWIYANSAPSGWTIVPTIAADSIIGVKSSAGTYTTGGLLAGTWTQPSHSHSAGSFAATSHNHRYSNYNADNNVNYYDSNGNEVSWNSTSIYKIVAPNYGPVAWVSSGDGWGGRIDLYTSNSSPGIGGTSGTSATVNTWRPYANVGIICSKN